MSCCAAPCSRRLDRPLSGELHAMERAEPFVKDLRSAIILDHEWLVYINATSTVESGLKTIPCGPLSVNVAECWGGKFVKSKSYRLNR
jgi:hypothetical protein